MLFLGRNEVHAQRLANSYDLSITGRYPNLVNRSAPHRSVVALARVQQVELAVHELDGRVGAPQQRRVGGDAHDVHVLGPPNGRGRSRVDRKAGALVAVAQLNYAFGCRERGGEGVGGRVAERRANECDNLEAFPRNSPS